MQNIKTLILVICICLPLCFMCKGTFAQGLLDRTTTFNVQKKPLRDVLVIMGKQGGFSFSYNSSIIPKDSLITIAVKNRPVRQVLGTLLGEQCQYIETENHIIIQPADREKWFTVSGYLVDEVTGSKVGDASVFEEQQLVSTLSDATGYFKPKPKNN